MTGEMETTAVLAWHGTRADGTTNHLTVKEELGVKTYLNGEVILCQNALHGSIKAIDMLFYSPGLWVKRTLHEGVVIQEPDKIGSSQRTVIAEADATQLVTEWGFWCADRAVRINAVAALRRVGMEAEAEKLAQLAEIIDRKSANAAVDVAANVARTARAANVAAAVNNSVADVVNGAARVAADAAYIAGYVATRIAHPANVAYVTARVADVFTGAITVAAEVAASAAYAAYVTAIAAYGVAGAIHVDYVTVRIDETDFINAELERRLFTLMGITETEGIK